VKPWTKFEFSKQVVGPDKVVRDLEDQVVMATNSRFAVTITDLGQDQFWLSFKNRDRSAHHDWRDIQRMKNELVGPEREAFEIYPAESRLHDTADQFHLWVLPAGESVPFGFDDRYVCEIDPPGTGSQRDFEVKPSDLLTEEEHAAMPQFVKWFRPDQKEEDDAK